MGPPLVLFRRSVGRLLKISSPQKRRTDILGFDNWCLENSMVLNISKSKCLIIGSRNKLSKVDYEL